MEKKYVEKDLSTYFEPLPTCFGDFPNCFETFPTCFEDFPTRVETLPTCFGDLSLYASSCITLLRMHIVYIVGDTPTSAEANAAYRSIQSGKR